MDRLRCRRCFGDVVPDSTDDNIVSAVLPAGCGAELIMKEEYKITCPDCGGQATFYPYLDHGTYIEGTFFCAECGSEGDHDDYN